MPGQYQPVVYTLAVFGFGIAGGRYLAPEQTFFSSLGRGSPGSLDSKQPDHCVCMGEKLQSLDFSTFPAIIKSTLYIIRIYPKGYFIGYDMPEIK